MSRGAEGYCAFARDYYDAELEAQAERHVYGFEPLTPQLVARLNPGAVFVDLVDELRG